MPLETIGEDFDTPRAPIGRIYFTFWRVANALS